MCRIRSSTLMKSLSRNVLTNNCKASNWTKENSIIYFWRLLAIEIIITFVHVVLVVQNFRANLVSDKSELVPLTSVCFFLTAHNIVFYSFHKLSLFFEF